MSTDWTFQLGRVSPPAKRQILNGATMGSRYSSVFYADCDLSMPALHAALQEAVDRVDQQMSTWKETSDLNRLNRAPIGEWCPIPQDLQTVLECALRISRQSGSLFNIAVGANVNAWGLGRMALQAQPLTNAALIARRHMTSSRFATARPAELRRSTSTYRRSRKDLASMNSDASCLHSACATGWSGSMVKCVLLVESQMALPGRSRTRRRNPASGRSWE